MPLGLSLTVQRGRTVDAPGIAGIPIFDMALTANEHTMGGQTNRIVIPLLGPSLGEIRVRVEASTAGPLQCNNLAIGQWAAHAAPDDGNFGETTGIPTELKFDGNNSGVGVPAGEMKWSDWTPVPVLSGFAVFILDNAASSFARYAGGLGNPSAGGTMLGFQQGASFNSAAATISALMGRALGVSRIETR